MQDEFDSLFKVDFKHFQSYIWVAPSLATHSFKFTVFLQNWNFSKEMLTIIIIAPWFQACIYWKQVCYMTTSFTAIHFFYDSIIISREQSTFQRNCLYFTILFATIHYRKRKREKVEEYVYLWKTIVALLF